LARLGADRRGTVRMPFSRFAFWSGTGAVVWATAYTSVGVAVGTAYRQFGHLGLATSAWPSRPGHLCRSHHLHSYPHGGAFARPTPIRHLPVGRRKAVSLKLPEKLPGRSEKGRRAHVP